MRGAGEDPGHVEAAQEEAPQPADPGSQDRLGAGPIHRAPADSLHQGRVDTKQNVSSDAFKACELLLVLNKVLQPCHNV